MARFASVALALLSAAGPVAAGDNSPRPTKNALPLLKLGVGAPTDFSIPPVSAQKPNKPAAGFFEREFQSIVLPSASSRSSNNKKKKLEGITDEEFLRVSIIVSRRIEMQVAQEETESLKESVDAARKAGKKAEALAGLEKLLAVLKKQCDRLAKEEQRPGVLERLEQARAALGEAHLQFGMLSEGLDSPSRNEAPKKLRVIVDEVVLRSSVRSGFDMELEQAASIRRAVHAALKVGKEAEALEGLEKLIAVFQERRDRFGVKHQQQPGVLEKIELAKAALGRAHLQFGLLSEVIQGRREVARLEAAGATKKTLEELALARDRLSKNEKLLTVALGESGQP